MERIVIVAYKPFPGKERQLEGLMVTHWNVLNKEGLVSNRKSIVCKSSDGTLIEIFGWKSKEALEAAHTNPAVQRMWAQYAEVCEYIPIGDVEESKGLFSEFSPFDGV